MRPLMIKPVPESIEGLLLLKQIVTRLSCLKLKRSVHPLMPAVLLRIARLNPFQLDAKPNPPDGKSGHIPCRIAARKGNPVITSYRRRNAVLLEGFFED